MLRKILVPLDGSSLSAQSLPTAIDIVRRAAATLEIVRVHAALPANVDGTDLHWLDDQVRRDDTQYLESLAERIRSENAIEVTTQLLEAPAAMAICHAAERTGADLIVMSTHGRSGLSRIWLGSVAEGVARHTTVPVLLLKPDATDGSEPQHVRLFSHILIPLDGTVVGESVISHATALGGLFGAHYTLVRELAPSMIASSVSPFGEVTYQEDAAQVEQRVTAVENYLLGIAAKMRAADQAIRVQIHACVDRSAASAILRQATREGADLIALTTHTGGVARALFGSVADKVLRGSEVPVLIYRPSSA